MIITFICRKSNPLPFIIYKNEKIMKLKNLVRFRSKLMVLPQKFDRIEVCNNQLICDNIEFAINENVDLVRKIVAKIESPISLQSLTDLEAIDFELRDNIKEYIDHLVFALYCNIQLEKIEFSDFTAIKKQCQESQFYHLIFE